MDEDTGRSREAMRVFQDLVVLEPGTVVEVVGDDSRERDPKGRVGVALVGRPANFEGLHGVLPVAPALRRAAAYARVGIDIQEVVVGSDEVPVLLPLGDAFAEARPRLGEEPSGLVIEPVDVSRPGEADGCEHQFADALWVALCVGKRERRSPGNAPDEPALYSEMFPQPLEIGDQVIGRVGIELGVVGHARGTAAGAALVKQDDSVRTRIERAPHAGRAT